MKYAIAVLLLLVIALAWLLNAEMTATREQKAEIDKLTLRLADKSRRENLELQEKCALQAERMVRILGFDGGYKSHYNAKLNKCFIAVETGTVSPQGRLLRITNFLNDAYEQKEYARFHWEAGKGKSLLDPDICQLRPQEGGRSCESLQEYNAFVARYME